MGATFFMAIFVLARRQREWRREMSCMAISMRRVVAYRCSKTLSMRSAFLLDYYHSHPLLVLSSSYDFPSFFHVWVNHQVLKYMRDPIFLQW